MDEFRLELHNNTTAVRANTVRKLSRPRVLIPPSRWAMATTVPVLARTSCPKGLRTKATPLFIRSRCRPHRQHHSRALFVEGM